MVQEQYWENLPIWQEILLKQECSKENCLTCWRRPRAKQKWQMDRQTARHEQSDLYVLSVTLSLILHFCQKIGEKIIKERPVWLINISFDHITMIAHYSISNWLFIRNFKCIMSLFKQIFNLYQFHIKWHYFCVFIFSPLWSGTGNMRLGNVPFRIFKKRSILNTYPDYDE